MRGLTRIDGQAGDLLVELAARSSNMLAEIFQQNDDQILALTIELLHMVDVIGIHTSVEVGGTGDMMQEVIQHLQNRGEVLMHLRHNLFLRQLLLRIHLPLAFRKRARFGGQTGIAQPALEDLVAS